MVRRGRESEIDGERQSKRKREKERERTVNESMREGGEENEEE